MRCTRIPSARFDGRRQHRAPGPSLGGQTPAVVNPSIEPASGSGSGTIILRVTATDPQGNGQPG